MLVGFSRMGQPNLHFTIDNGGGFVLLLNPALKRRGPLLSLMPVDPFPDYMNYRQHRKNDNEDLKR